jgi:HSP20 family protein
MALPSFFGRRNNYWGASDPAEVIVTLFENAPAGSYARDAHAAASTSVDWKETPAEHVFKVDLPGVRKEDVTVQVEDGRTLSIHGKRQKEEVKETDTWHRVERSSGHFQRKFRLPETANLDHIAAKMDSGVLTVTVPKVEKKKGKRVIEIGGHDEKPAALTLEDKAAETETAAAPEHKATDGSTPAHGGQQ